MNTTENKIFDEWDYKVFDYIKKAAQPKVDNIITIWAKRNMVDEIYIGFEPLFFHFYELFNKTIGAKSAYLRKEFFKRVSPENLWGVVDWLYISDEKDKEIRNIYNKDKFVEFDHEFYWSAMLASVLIEFSCAKVSDIEGYREWIDSNK